VKKRLDGRRGAKMQRGLLFPAHDMNDPFRVHFRAHIDPVGGDRERVEQTPIVPARFLQPDVDVRPIVVGLAYDNPRSTCRPLEEQGGIHRPLRIEILGDELEPEGDRLPRLEGGNLIIAVPPRRLRAEKMSGSQFLPACLICGRGGGCGLSRNRWSRHSGQQQNECGGGRHSPDHRNAHGPLLHRQMLG
jgi:hypothetical protein